MYCTNCGAKIEDSAAFCPYCGTPARNREQIPPVTEPPESGRPLSAQSTAIRKKPRRKKARIIAVVSVSVVIAAAAAIFGLVRLFRNDESYRETVDLFLEANAACDLEEIVELVPDKVVSAMIEGLGYAPLTTREFVEIGQENWNSYLENTYGEDWRSFILNLDFSYSIEGREELSEDAFNDLYEKYDKIGVEISDAITAEVATTLEDEESLEISLIKSGGSWYLDAVGMNMVSFWQGGTDGNPAAAPAYGDWGSQEWQAADDSQKRAAVIEVMREILEQQNVSISDALAEAVEQQAADWVMSLDVYYGINAGSQTLSEFLSSPSLLRELFLSVE